MPNGELLSLELQPPSGNALRVDLDPGCVRDLRTGSKSRGGGTTNRCWSLASDLDWGFVAELSLIAASFEDGGMLAVAALRPREADGHDADILDGVMVSPQGDAVHLEEVLLSAEYGPDGKTRRLGLELYKGLDGPPVRVAADRIATAEAATGDRAGERSVLRIRMAGTPGVGLHELIRNAQPDSVDGR
jgi:hypothetical protein